MNRKERRANKKKNSLKSSPSGQPTIVAQPVSSTELQNAKNLINSGNYADGTKALLEIIKEDPTNPEALEYMALAAERIGNYDAALNMFLSIYKIFPDRQMLRVYIGHMLVKLDRNDEALEHLLPIVKSSPELLKPQFLCGLAYLYLGDFKNMEEHFLSTLEIDPEHIEALYNYLTSKKVIEDKENPFYKTLIKLKAQYDSNNLPNHNDAVLLHFTLYKVHEDLKEYDAAFEYLLEATQLKRSKLNYSTDAAKEYFRLVKNYFSKDLFTSVKPENNSSDIPVFILGMPRSGTTLLEQIMHAHPDIEGIGENAVLDLMIKEYSHMEPFNGAKYPLRANQKTKETLSVQQIADKYIEYLEQRCPGAKRVINKSITNIHWVGFIALAFPNAKLIHLKRNPLDSCLSSFSKNFTGDGQTFSYNMKEMGEYYAEYMELLDHWNKVFPEKILNIEYESIVADIETEAKKVIEFIGLEWDENCLKFYEAKKSVRTASASQVRQPIYNKAVDRWRRYENHLSPLIESLGKYAPSDAPK